MSIRRMMLFTGDLFKIRSLNFDLKSSIATRPNMLIPKTDGSRPIWFDNSSIGKDLAFSSEVNDKLDKGTYTGTAEDLKNDISVLQTAIDGKQDRLQSVTGYIGVGKSDDSATEKLDVNGNVKAIGYKTPTGTATQSLTANGGTFDLNLKLSTEAPSTTGTVISFSTDKVYGTLTTPETGNITADITNAKLGVTNIIIHNSATAPTFGSQFKKLSGSGNYTTGVVNYIYCTFISATEIIYSINQRT